jgi:hypothetical protein
MKTTLRRLFNYWLPPGHSSDKETPNPLVEVAVKIQASTAALLSGAEVDWDEINRENEEWWRLTNRVVRREGMVELTRLTEEMDGYDR